MKDERIANNERQQVLHRCTRGEALAGGLLVDVTEAGARASLTLPVALTCGVFQACVAVDGAGEKEIDRLWRVLWGLRVTIWNEGADQTALRYIVLVPDGEHSQRQVALIARSGHDDAGNRCITIMLPDEDLPPNVLAF